MVSLCATLLALCFVPPVLLMGALIPVAGLLACSMSRWYRRTALLAELESQSDPRRGLDFICTELVDRLYSGMQADVVALVLPSGSESPAMIASRKDGTFRVSASVHTCLESLLTPMPDFPMSYAMRRRWDPRASMRPHQTSTLHDKRVAAFAAIAELAKILKVRHLYVLPLTRHGRQHGHLLMGHDGGLPGAGWGRDALDGVVRGLVRSVEHAALIDQLQEESARHERARIGRDLHDSAIQPYLGLKYAVEAVALRIPADNPARAEVDALAVLVNGQVASLQELISTLRTGHACGDDALVLAVRRQAQRFASLFGIEVEVDCPVSLPTSRAIAGAVFHMVNEALNNIRKHTTAHRVRISLSMEPSALRLLVQDDGAAVNGGPPEDFYPVSLAERAAGLGATLHISRAGSTSTQLVIRIPL